MSLPDITLSRGNILIIESASRNSIDAGDFNFGLVQIVYPTCDNYSVGDSIFYTSSTGEKMRIEDDVYILINEKDIKGIEA